MSKRKESSSEAVEAKPKGRGYRPNPARPLDEARKAKFLAELREHGIVGEAMAKVSLHAKARAFNTFYQARERDPEFAAAWDDALEYARSKVERELHRRAVEGYEEPVFWKGEECGTIIRYSDALLLARMRALDPRYRQQNRVELSGSVTVRPLDLDSLSPESRQMLRVILEREVKRIDDDRSSSPLRITVDPNVSSLSKNVDKGENEEEPDGQE
jgi:hypothetical protein